MVLKTHESRKTILLADSEQRRRGPVSLLLAASGYHLIVAGGGVEAIEKSREYSGPIHLLLANVEMPEMTGIELGLHLNRQRPDMKMFLLSTSDSGMLVLDHGWQFLPAPFALEMLRTRIRDILKDPQPAANESPLNCVGERRSLTKREIQVLKLIASGHSTKQIADILGVAFKTSVGHRTRLMRKLNIHDSVTLVRYAIRAGIIDP